MIDRRAIERLFETVGRDENSLVELIHCFLDEGPELVSSLALAAGDRDFTTMRRSAHSLKSNARDFGATELSDRCAEIEDDLRAGLEPNDALERADRVSACWDAVEATLRQIADLKGKLS